MSSKALREMGVPALHRFEHEFSAPTCKQTLCSHSVPSADRSVKALLFPLTQQDLPLISETAGLARNRKDKAIKFYLSFWLLSESLTAALAVVAYTRFAYCRIVFYGIYPTGCHLKSVQYCLSPALPKRNPLLVTVDKENSLKFIHIFSFIQFLITTSLKGVMPLANRAYCKKQFSVCNFHRVEKENGEKTCTESHTCPQQEITKFTQWQSSPSAFQRMSFIRIAHYGNEG